MRGVQKKKTVRVGLLAAALALCAFGARAEENTSGWSDTAEFSYVVTAGNSESSTLGFKNTLGRKWDKSSFTVKAGGIRVETTSRSPVAVGDFTVFTVDPRESTDTTAENYFLNGRYDRKISGTFFWYTGAGWDRNRFAGIQNRYIVSGGVGNVWFDTDDLKFKTDYALTFTDQKDVVVTPGVEDTFLGARGSWEYLNKLGANTVYTNSLVVDINLDETSDWRGDMVNSVSVAMNEHLALKVSLQWLYDNDPAFESVPLFDLPLTDPLAVQLGTVAVQLDELDTVFTTSLVVNF